MRVLVCGGRDYKDKGKVYLELGCLLDQNPIECIIQGGAKGVDHWAKAWALSEDIIVETFLPDWNKYGVAAGPIRNKQMLDEGKPDLVIAFPGGKGTANMIKQAEARGIKVIKRGP